MSNMAFFFVVCDDDVPLLYLASQCLYKNWTGPKNIVIVSDYCKTDFKSIIDAVLQGWNITYIDTPSTSLKGYYAQGWYRQQVYKLISPISTSYDWFIILDCKNLMVRPASELDFINENKELAIAGTYDSILKGWQAHSATYVDEYIERMTTESKELVSGPESDLLIYTITPQIFKKEVLVKMDDSFKFNQIRDWKGTEFFIYWYYYNTYYNPKWMTNCHAVVSDIYEQRWGKPALTKETLFLNLHRKNLDSSAIPTLTELAVRGIIDQSIIATFFKLVHTC